MAQAPELYHLPGFYDPVSSISHLLGVGLFAFLGAMLIRRCRHTWADSGYLWVYVVSSVVLFTVSGTYHMLPRGETPRNVMERVDRDAIYFLIAGTYTPIHGILFRAWMRWGALTLIWGVALASILMTSVFGDLPEWVGGVMYGLMGWFSLGPMVILARRYGLRFIRPLIAGGVVYSLGALADFAGEPIILQGVVQSHELFHLAILLGAFLHWQFIWKCANAEEPCHPECYPVCDGISTCLRESENKNRPNEISHPTSVVDRAKRKKKRLVKKRLRR